MTIFYDFDGTLTPNSIPIYPIIIKCGLSMENFYEKVFKEKDIYSSLCTNFAHILKSNNYDLNPENIGYGAENTEFNLGVIQFLTYLKNQNVNNVVLTSGFSEYVKKTKVAKYLEEVIGTTIDNNGNPIKLVRDDIKPQMIEEYIEKHNIVANEVIYIGDGLTDKFAFEYVKKIGGISILLYNDNEKDLETKNKLQELNIIDKAFNKDFSLDRDLFIYISKLINERKENNEY